MHQPIPKQGAWLKQVVRAFCLLRSVKQWLCAASSLLLRGAHLAAHVAPAQPQGSLLWNGCIAWPPDGSPSRVSFTLTLKAAFAVRHPRWERAQEFRTERICAGCAVQVR